MAVNLQNIPKVRISYDEMEAFLFLPMPLPDEQYYFDEVVELVKSSGVKEGIDEKKIASMINEGAYGRECLIAIGTPAVDGVDGYYEYHFNNDFNKKPTRRDDGTVDYWSIHTVEVVHEGQVIATYHDPVDGTNGMSVKGKTLMAKRGRPLPPLAGKGFERAEDNVTYIATMDGKIEMKSNRIMISNVHEINGDIGPNTGNIDFLGDVIIHGSVPNGAIVKATGSITIDGTVEGCYLDANKDIIIRGGMLGANRGNIRTRGSLYAKFIQYAKVKAEGTIDLDSAIECNIICNDRVYVHGKYGSIIGGVIHAAKGVECANFGNELGIKTEVYVGVNIELKKQVKYIEDTLQEAKDTLEKVSIGLKQLEDMAKESGQSVANDPRKVSLLRAKIQKQADISMYTHQLERLNDIVENAQGAAVKAIHNVFSGVTVGINDAVTHVKEEQEAVAFFERNGKIVMFSMKGELVG